MGEEKRLIKNTGIIAIGNISTKLVSFFLLPLYTAILSTGEYGTVDYIISIATFCIPFVSMLMDEAIFRFLIDCKNRKDEQKVVSTSLIVLLVGIALFLVISVPFSILIDYRYSAYLIIYVISSTFVMMVSALLRGFGKISSYALFNFLVSAGTVSLNVLFIAVFHWGIQGMVLASIYSSIVFGIIYSVKITIWKYFNFRNLDKALFKSMIGYSIPLIPNKISWNIINLSDRLIIMNVLGSSDSGLYSVSYKFPTLMDTVYGFFYQSWKESSARVLNKNEQKDFYNRVYKYLKKFMYSIVIGMIAFMPLCFCFLINNKFHNAILYVPILLMSTYFSNISGFYGGVFTAYKDTTIMGTSTVVAAVINLVINVALIWKVGLYAAAISTFIANFLVYLYRRIKVRRYVQLIENRKQMIISWFALGIVCILFYSMNTGLQIIGGVISVFYAFVENLELLRHFLNRIRR